MELDKRQGRLSNSGVAIALEPSSTITSSDLAHAKGSQFKASP